MRCHLRTAKARHQQGNQSKSTGLGKKSQANRQAQAKQSHLHGPVRPFEMGKWKGGAVRRAAANPKQHAQQVEPHRHQGGPSATQAAHRRKAQVAEHQYPTEQHVKRQSQQRHHHHGFGLVDAGAVAVKHAVGRKSGQPKTGNQHKVLRHSAGVRFQRHPSKNQLGGLQDRGGNQPQQQAFPERLAHHMRHLPQVLRTHMVGYGGVDRHQQADQGDDDNIPQRHAQGHTGQVLRRNMAGHRHCGHRHTDVGQLPHQNWPGQSPQRAHFIAQNGLERGSCRFGRWGMHGRGDAP